MTVTEALHTRDVERRLAEAERTIEALLSGEIDAVVDAKSSTPVLLGKAQDALRDERDRAQRYLDTPDVVLLALDLDARVTLANRYACAVLGWPAAELMGRDWIETCVPHRIRVETRRRFAEVIGGTRTGGENLVVTASGEERVMGWRHTVLKDPAGRVIGTFSAGADITERDRAVEELRQRAQLSALSAAVGLSLASGSSLVQALQQCADALVLHLEAALARIWILNEREGVLELQASAGLYTHHEGPQRTIPLGDAKIGRIALDRQPQVTNTVADDPEVGDQDWARREGMVAFAGYPLIADGRVVGVMAVFARTPLPPTIVSKLASVADHVALGIDRHRSADALQTAEERMRFSLTAAGVGFWDKDFTSGKLEWSEILEAQHGLPPGTFGGTFEAFTDCVHADDRASLVATMSKATAAGGDFTLLYRVVHPAGTTRWLSCIGQIVHGAQGKPVRGVGICQDVTERHALEAQYLQAQKMEAVGRLAGGIAHDFNNLLTVILGFCELLLADRATNDPHRPDILEIQKAGTRAAGLTGQLLAFSRKQIVEPTRLDLNVVVAGMESMLARLIGEDIRIVVTLRPGLAATLADRGQVEQVILNLVVNGRDAMPQGGTLSIDTASVELDEHYAAMHHGVTPGWYVALTVSDTGIGMTPQVQARLFEPFFTTKEVGKGTGLGLATVHGIVSRSGGHVAVYSEIGRGTSFKVYFPQSDAAERAAETPAPVARRSEGATVLVVEDADGLRALIGRMLRRQRYTVLSAASGEDARRLFEENPAIDLVLSDVVMPGTSGPALMTELLKQRPAVKVIYMSGYTEDAIVQHGVLDPTIAFLHKPFTGEKLERKMREVLDR